MLLTDGIIISTRHVARKEGGLHVEEFALNLVAFSYSSLGFFYNDEAFIWGFGPIRLLPKYALA